MKTLLAWLCGLTVTANAVAMTGLDAYYQGEFGQAAALWKANPNLTSLEEYCLGRMYLYGYGILKSNYLANRSFKNAAEKGSVSAQLLMAKIELFQNNNPEQALFWFKKAAKASDVSAQMYCAAAYLFGVGVAKNEDLAREFYTAAAKNNNGIAQYNLATYFLNDKKTVNQKLGLVWLHKAVELKDPEAELLLADLLRKGELVEKNQDQAAKLMEHVVTQGYVPAYFKMGQLAFQREEPEVAKDWYEKAAQLEYIPAQIALAEMYLDPSNAHYSLHEGFFWMQKAAVLGDAAAQKAVAAMYRKGEGVEANEALANEWEQKSQQLASDRIKTQQLRQMAEWLSRGKVSRLEDSSYQLPGIYTVWQEKTALQDNIYNQSPKLHPITQQDIFQLSFNMMLPNDIPISRYYDAMMHTQADRSNEPLVFAHYPIPTPQRHRTAGDRVRFAQREGYDYLSQMSSVQPDDYRLLFQHLLSKAQIGDSSAQFDVALMYQQGVGVSQSIDEALKFYQLAAAQNDLSAEYHLGLIYFQGKGVVPDYKIGMEWLTDAAFKGNYYAQYALARIYDGGYQDKTGRQVVAADNDQALALYQLAATSEYGPAQYRLAEILVRQPINDHSEKGLYARQQRIKHLFQSAVAYGVDEAKLALAFYNASDADEIKQAEAFADAKQAAAAGNSKEAAFLLGMMYDRGIATQADPKLAVYWYQQASANPITAYILGTYAAEGKGMPKNLDQAADYLNFAATKNFAQANFNLAVLKKQQGKDFLNDLQTAAGLGLSTAGITLADYYLTRNSTPVELQRAAALYEQFAQQGLQSAQLKLGYLYENGLGVNKDYHQALNWYTAAAKQGETQAQYLIGRLYQFGKIGVLPNQAVAKQWYAPIKAKYAPAAIAYGFMDEIDNDDYQHAFSEYQQAADLGDPIGQYDLGLVYEKGKNQEVNLDLAKDLYKQAAQKNIVKAMSSLGAIYALELNISKAVPWFNLAISFKDADAAYQMGWLAEKGLLPHGSMAQAIEYYQQAAAQGQANSILALARLYQSGVNIQQDLEKSAGYYAQLANDNYPEAQYELAKCCLSNSIKLCTAQEAKTWLIKAEHNGYKNAAQLLRLLQAQSQDNVSYIESIMVLRG